MKGVIDEIKKHKKCIICVFVSFILGFTLSFVCTRESFRQADVHDRHIESIRGRIEENDRIVSGITDGITDVQSEVEGSEQRIRRASEVLQECSGIADDMYGRIGELSEKFSTIGNGLTGVIQRLSEIREEVIILEDDSNRLRSILSRNNDLYHSE